MNYNAAILAEPSLLGFWRDVNGVPVDLKGGNNGAYQGTATSVAGRAVNNESGNAMNILGVTGDAVAISPTPVLTTELTVEAWIMEVGSAPNGRAVDRSNSIAASPFSDFALETNSTAGIWLFEWTAGGVYYQLGTLAAVGPRWHHVVGTYNGSAGRMYLDGILQSEIPSTGAVGDRGMPLYFGRYGPDPTIVKFAGEIDAVAVYGTAISADAVARHYNEGRPGIGGFRRDPNTGGILMTTVGPFTRQRGFMRAANSVLGYTTAGGTWQSGFLRDASGLLCVNVGGVGTWQSGFLRDSTGALCVATTGFTNQSGLPHDSAGRLGVVLS